MEAVTMGMVVKLRVRLRAPIIARAQGIPAKPSIIEDQPLPLHITAPPNHPDTNNSLKMWDRNHFFGNAVRLRTSFPGIDTLELEHDIMSGWASTSSTCALMLPGYRHKTIADGRKD